MSDAAVYATLIIIAFFLTVLLILTLIFNSLAFIIMLGLYILGIAIYQYIYFVRNPKTTDINYSANKYISLYNIGIGGLIIVLGIIFTVIRVGSSMRR